MKDRNRNKIKGILLIFICILLSAPIVNAEIFVNTNRNVVLDDPNPGGQSDGFTNPPRNWNSNYWTGESTTIRAVALTTGNDGSVRSGITVTFNLKNPFGSIVNTSTYVTNSNGTAYYSFDLNTNNYWGYWTIEASATIDGTPKQNKTSFILNWWGCADCHRNKNPGAAGTYTPKSYYVKGFNFHKSIDVSQHSTAMSGGNCTRCHKSYDIAADWHSGKLACAQCHEGSNLSIRPQGKNPEIAGCYDTNGCHTKKNANLDEINTTTGYVVGGNYRTKYSFVPDNATKAHTTTSVECIACHNSGHNITKPYNSLTGSNSVTENEQCWNCHTSRETTHKLNNNCVSCHSQNAHNVSITGAGGPDCISCHNTGGSATHEVDVSAINSGVHANLNSGATAIGVDPANKKCWGCHQTGGTQPTDMGDRYTNPYKCYDCHNATKPYPNVNNALTVDEHFKSGTDIQAAISAPSDYSSCITCHNIAEMKVFYTELDSLNTESSLTSHYGKSRSELRTGEGGSTDCKYCHQNGSTAFSVAMSNVENKNVVNHSSTNTPVCTTCHNTGKLHDSSLSKPANSDDNYCKTCHAEKEEHKTLYCTECHANNTDGSRAGREIHGIKYLQKDNTFGGKINAADCTTCHQSNVVDGSLGTFVPEKIGELHHSNNITNGSRWNNYWTNSLEACLYCHNNSKHNLTPLGRPLLWNPSYVMRTTIGSGTNCADCHYSGDTNYVSMNTAFTGSGLNIPPEITSGNWNGKPGYFNHSLGDYTDLTCKNCHYQGASTVGQMMHDVSEGGGGGGGVEPGNYTGSSSNCKGCHPSQYAKWANSTHTSKLITKEDAMARGYPNPPGGYSWENVSFVIGSKWKIRYVNDTGYIITTGGKNQYNVDDQIWTDYNKDVVKKYNCGHCHATGYLENVSNTNKEPFKTLRTQGKIPDGVYDNGSIKGFIGYWAENSIGCEACHGQGGDHANNPSKLNIRNASEVRNSPEICGDCHSRPKSSKYGEYENFKQYPYGVDDALLNETLFDDSPMPTVNYSLVGGHHEQWEDWKASGHNSTGINCVSCHSGHDISDPAYAGGPTGKTKFTNGTVYPASVNQSCTSCHVAELPKHGAYTSNTECISCHMPINRKSSNKIDLRSHWFDIKALKDNKNGDIHAYNFNTLTGVTESCTYCHNSSIVNKPIYKTDVGMHKDVNKSEGIGLLNSSDCKTCHVGSVQTRICEDCHIDQVVSSPKVDEHNSRGLDVKTVETCSLCHNNSINRYKYTANASVGHYGTIASLINTSNCIDCHNGPYTNDPAWGSPVNISTSTKRAHTETTTAECDNCHKDSSVSTLAGVSFHNAAVRLGVGQGDNCLDCHVSAG